MANSMGFIILGICLAVTSVQASAAGSETSISKADGVEIHCVAVPTSELTADAAKEYNVTRDPHRGLLTVTILHDLGHGKTKPLQAQVFAGAINQNNNVSTIPVREVLKGDEIYYLGEFRVTPPDTLRFLVNASTLHGKPLKAEFSRAFGAP